MITNSTESSLLDLRISKTVIDFAQALLKRYNLEYARNNREGRQLDIDFEIDPDDDDALSNNQEYSEEAHSNMGEGNGILKCIEILHELVDGEMTSHHNIQKFPRCSICLTGGHT